MAHRRRPWTTRILGASPGHNIDEGLGPCVANRRTSQLMRAKLSGCAGQQYARRRRLGCMEQ